MKNNVKKIFISLFLILLFLIIIVFYIENKSKNVVNENLQYINSEEWKNEIFAEGTPKLYRMCDCEYTAKTIGKSMYNVAINVFPKYYNELKNSNEQKISNYFKNNKQNIAIEVGIVNENDFIKLINNLKTLSSNELNFNSYRIDKEKIIKRTDYTLAILYIKYENNNEIGFNVKIYNKIKEKESSLRYTSL